MPREEARKSCYICSHVAVCKAFELLEQAAKLIVDDAESAARIYQAAASVCRFYERGEEQ